MARLVAGFGLALALASVLPAWGQSYPSPTFQALTIQADPAGAAQAARKGYVDAAAGSRILSSTLGQPNGPAQLGSNGLLPAAQLPVGTAAGTVAAGNDSRITGALSASAAAAAYLPLSGGSVAGTLNAGTNQVNYVQIGGAPTGYGSTVLAQGSDTNVSLALGAKGNGTVYMASPVTLTTPLSLGNGGTGQTTAAAALSALGGAPLASPAFTGGVSLAGGLIADAAGINAAVTAERVLAYQTGGVLRFKAGLAATTEPGANAGSDYALYRYADNGAYIGRAFAVTRASGLLTIDAGANVAGGLTADTASVTGTSTAATLRVGTTSGPTWTTGTGAPTSTQPVGSLYSRTDGTAGNTLYVSRGGGTWNAAAGL